jgi:hypothetical protein
MKRSVVLGVDVESLGSNLTYHHTSQIGAAVVDMETGQLLGLFSEYIKNEEKIICSQTDVSLMLNDARDVIINSPNTQQAGWSVLDTVMSFFMKFSQIYGFEERCRREFWDLFPQRKAETLQQIYAPNTLTEAQAIRKLVAWAREVCEGCKVKVVTDTSGFDIGRLDKMFPLPSQKEDAPSMNYLFLDNDGNPAYQGIEQVTSFAKGISSALTISNPPGLGSFELACHALGVEVPVFEVSHDHNPGNDAAVIAMKYAFLRRACNNFVANKN